MKRIYMTLMMIVALFIYIPHSRLSAQESLNEHLEPFRPFLGKTWKGRLSAPGSEQPQYDVSRWERALNGQAIRILHSVNDGLYGGETLLMWDEGKNSLVFFYFTTANFYTTGTMSYEDGKFISHEKVNRVHNGITEVRAIGEILPDGKMRSSSQYLQNGEWVKGHEIIYEEAADAEIVFR